MVYNQLSLYSNSSKCLSSLHSLFPQRLYTLMYTHALFPIWIQEAHLKKLCLFEVKTRPTLVKKSITYLKLKQKMQRWLSW